MAYTKSQSVHKDLLRVDPAPFATVTVTHVAGGTVYYADSTALSATQNQGTLTVGLFATFTNEVWLLSASESDVSLAYGDSPMPIAQLPVAVINGVIGSQGRQNQFVLFGDSMTASYGPTAAVGNLNADNSQFVWANYYLGGRLEVTQNLGVPGNSSADGLARIATVLADPAPNAWVEFGTNDNNHALTTAQSIASLTSIYQQLVAAGKRVYATTVIPKPTSGTGAVSAASKKQMLAINRFIRTYCRQNPGMVLIDPFPFLMDQNAEPAANMLLTADGLHPTRLAAQIWGRVLAAAILPILGGNERRPTGQSSATGNPYNHTTLSTFMGGGGTATPAGFGVISGAIASGWTVTLTAGSLATSLVTCSLVPRTDGVPGNWQQISVSGANTALLFQRGGQPDGVAGQSAIGRMEIDAPFNDWVAVTQFSLLCIDATSGYYGACMDNGGGGDPAPLANPGYGIMETPPILPAGVSNGSAQTLRFYFQATGGTVRVGMCETLYPAEA